MRELKMDRWPLNMLIAMGLPINRAAALSIRQANALTKAVLSEFDAPTEGRVPNIRRVLEMRFRDGRQNGAIGCRIGVSENAVSATVGRAKEAAKSGFLFDLLNGSSEPSDAFLDSRPVDALMFGMKSAIALANAGINTLGEVREFVTAGLLADIPDIGESRRKVIEDRLGYYGIESVTDIKHPAKPEERQEEKKPEEESSTVAVQIPQKEPVVPTVPSDYPFGKPTVLTQQERKDKQPVAPSSPAAQSAEAPIKPSWVHREPEKIIDRRYLLVGGRHRLKGTYEKGVDGEIQRTDVKTVDDASIFNGFIPVEAQELNERQALMRIQYELERHPGLNHITVFVTGNAEAQLAIINVCRRLEIGLTFMIYYRDKNYYYPMVMAD